MQPGTAPRPELDLVAVDAVAAPEVGQGDVVGAARVGVTGRHLGVGGLELGAARQRPRLLRHPRPDARTIRARVEVGAHDVTRQLDGATGEADRAKHQRPRERPGDLVVLGDVTALGRFEVRVETGAVGPEVAHEDGPHVRRAGGVGRRDADGLWLGHVALGILAFACLAHPRLDQLERRRGQLRLVETFTVVIHAHLGHAPILPARAAAQGAGAHSASGRADRPGSGGTQRRFSPPPP